MHTRSGLENLRRAQETSRRMVTIMSSYTAWDRKPDEQHMVGIRGIFQL